MGWLGDGSHRGQGCQAWMAVGLPPRYHPGTQTDRKRSKSVLCCFTIGLVMSIFRLSVDWVNWLVFHSVHHWVNHWNINCSPSMSISCPPPGRGKTGIHRFQVMLPSASTASCMDEWLFCSLLGFNVQLNTFHVISETIFSANLEKN